MNFQNTLHKGPRILVPVLIDGMVIDQDVLTLTRGDWATAKAQYKNTVRYGAAFPKDTAVARSISTFPDIEAPEIGVHLQWMLPKGLRRGQQDEQGKLKFPLVPNRWLVIRTWYDQAGDLQVKGWVIQSDFIKHPSSDYKGSYTLVQEEEDMKCVAIGKAIPLEDWTGERAYRRVELTAIGPDDLTFSTYTVNNQNVFSFHDSLEDLEIEDEQQYDLGYVLSGWYGDSTEDPLYQAVFDRETLLEKMKELGFHMGNEIDLSKAEAALAQWSENSHETLAPLMLCHGAMHSISWPWKAGDKVGRPQVNSNKPETNPDIIIGNSSFDTLVTFIKERLTEANVTQEEADFATELLYAFDKKLLNEYIQPDGENLLENKIHRSWFIGSQAGDYWEIVQNKVGKDDEEKEKLKQLLQNTYPILEELNKVQTEFDKKRELRAARLQQFYTTLYAAKNQRRSRTRRSKWENKALDIHQDLQALGQAGQQLMTQIEQRKEEIYFELNITDEQGIESNFNLRQRKKPHFWEPDDPVILVHAAKTSPKHQLKTPPVCRYSGQFLHQLKVRDSASVFAPSVPALPQAAHIPKEMNDLIREFILLNPNYVQHYFDTQVATIQKQQTIIWNTERLEGLEVERLLLAAGFEGIQSDVLPIRPDFRSFKTFVLPWSPLFMDWKVYFFPTHGRLPIAESLAQQGLDNWTLEEDQFDFTWQDQIDVPKVNNDVKKVSWTVQGRSLLSSQMPEFLIERLKEFKEELQGKEKQKAIDTIITILSGFDLITQRLGGFNEYLQRYDIGNHVPHQLLKPKNDNIDISPLAGKNFGLPLGRLTKISNVPLNQYFPIRSGHLLVHYTRIVDDFGLGFYPVGRDEPRDESNILIPQDSTIIPKGKGLDHPSIKNTGLVQLKPRILQPTRLQMEWIDADTDAPVRQAVQNSPVCGWIIPNHLDKSLMIFDALGKLQGSLIFFKRNNQYHIRKALDPISANPYRFEIKNYHLNDFINELLALENQDVALSGFLEQIDKTTWVTDPLGAREKQGVSALIGRPMALVRAKVSMDLQGLPLPALDFQSPDAYDISAGVNPLGLMNVDFPFFVGSSIMPNNGLIGYFDSSNGTTSYKKFFVTTDHSSVETDYIQEQTVMTTRLNHILTPEAQRQSKSLSMLIDYRGIIHTISGLLPIFELQLPTKFTKEALANMEVTFRTGPLITDPHQLRMPKPNDISGKLSWIYRSGVNIWKEDEPLPNDKRAWEHKEIDEPLTNVNFPARRQQLSEGWLKLSEALKE